MLEEGTGGVIGHGYSTSQVRVGISLGKPRLLSLYHFTYKQNFWSESPGRLFGGSRVVTRVLMVHIICVGGSSSPDCPIPGCPGLQSSLARAAA